MYFTSEDKTGTMAGVLYMKRHIKFAFVVCCAAIIPLLSSRAATVTVTVGDGGFFFFPSSVTIQAGDTVKWTWSASGHSSTSGPPGSPDGLWDSGILSQGATFSHTFPSAGSFPYFCSPHGVCCGMVGSVTVTAAADTVQITRAQYKTSRSQLTVQATDSNDTATLTVSVSRSGVILGTMINNGGGNYSAKFTGISNPRNITVTSDFGGSDSARVRVR
jgi:plastocyanin